MDITKLKPCPFCGGEPELKLVGNAHTKKRAAHISCSTVGCTVEIRVAALKFDHEWCKDKASERWNKRCTDELEYGQLPTGCRYPTCQRINHET